jgi:hypothetical protein
VRALAAKGPSLRALHMQHCGYAFSEASATESAAWVELFRAASSLLWLNAGFLGVAPIRAAAFAELPPTLHALGYDVTRTDVPKAHCEAIEKARDRLSDLRWLMVLPDRAAESAIPLRAD